MSDSNSEKGAEASLTNGAKSFGSPTENEKTDALGFYRSVNSVLAADEPDEFEGFHKALYDELAPADAYQIVLVEKIIGALRRRNTLEDIVSSLLEVKTKSEIDVAAEFVKNIAQIESAFRNMRELDRTVASAKRELDNLQFRGKQKRKERTQDFDSRLAKLTVAEMLKPGLN